MTLYEKNRRLRVADSFKYVKPMEPSGYSGVANFKYQKGKPVLEQEGIKALKKGVAPFKTISREKRASVMNFDPPKKYTMDTGIGHVID